ncbi:MAG: PAS domain-containing protein, partial [Pedobacter sp.]|nr:PAS domain-containing protein [Pedobacter sp.]
FTRLIQNKETNQVVEYRFRCADGNYKHVLDRSFIIYDANGEAIRSIGSMQDISERISHINAIEAQNKKLTEITWMQSHSLRAPLARTLGLTALIAMEDNDIQDLKELSGMICDAVNELDTVLKDIIKKSS